MLSPRRPAITIRIFSSARILPARHAPNIPDGLLSFLGMPFYWQSHRSSFADYDERKRSLTQSRRSVSLVLTGRR
jgi:hypothetical protein